VTLRRSGSKVEQNIQQTGPVAIYKKRGRGRGGMRVLFRRARKRTDRRVARYSATLRFSLGRNSGVFLSLV